jgi:hypothetical protein
MTRGTFPKARRQGRAQGEIVIEETAGIAAGALIWKRANALPAWRRLGAGRNFLLPTLYDIQEAVPCPASQTIPIPIGATF